MSNLRIIYDNAADRAALTASSQAGALGAAALLTDEKTEVLRSAGTELTITATLPVGEIVGGVVLPFCNLTSNAKIRVRGYTAPADTVPVIDTGLVLACAYTSPGNDDIGDTPLVVNAYSYGGGTYARVWFPRDTARKFVIDISDPDNPAGYVEFARLVLGNYWSPERNASYGAGVTPVDTSTQYRTDGGSQRVERGAAYNTIQLQLDAMTPRDRANFWRIARGCGTWKPIFTSLYPESEDPELEQTHQVYGRLSGLSAIESPTYRTYATQINQEEI